MSTMARKSHSRVVARCRASAKRCSVMSKTCWATRALSSDLKPVTSMVYPPVTRCTSSPRAAGKVNWASVDGVMKQDTMQPRTSEGG